MYSGNAQYQSIPNQLEENARFDYPLQVKLRFDLNSKWPRRGQVDTELKEEYNTNKKIYSVECVIWRSFSCFQAVKSYTLLSKLRKWKAETHVRKPSVESPDCEIWGCFTDGLLDNLPIWIQLLLFFNQRFTWQLKKTSHNTFILFPDY